jgi:hypothetical protein
MQSGVAKAPSSKACKEGQDEAEGCPFGPAVAVYLYCHSTVTCDPVQGVREGTNLRPCTGSMHALCQGEARVQGKHMLYGGMLMLSLPACMLGNCRVFQLQLSSLFAISQM